MSKIILNICLLILASFNLISGQPVNSLVQKGIQFPGRQLDLGNASLMRLKLETPFHKSFNPLERDINYTAFAGIGAITLASGIAIHFYQANAWWREQSSKFRIINDWKYALWLDKLGHFYGTTLLYHAFNSSLEGANVEPENIALYSAIGAFAFQMYVEIEDGFGKNWGFSPGDASFDLMGALFSLGQYYYPVLKNFQPRLSYYPSKDFREGKRPDKGNIIDDYAGQKYWMAFRMKNLLPENIAKYWPSFLMLSVGMGIKNWDGFGGGQQELYLAFDLDAEELPLHGSFWEFVKNTLNYIHFPMPGVRITPNTAFFGLVY